MPQWTNSIDINTPQEAVFSFIIDPGKSPLWHRGVTHLEQISPGEPDVGTQYRMKTRVPGGSAESITEITAFDANELVVFEKLDRE